MGGGGWGINIVSGAINEKTHTRVAATVKITKKKIKKLEKKGVHNYSHEYDDDVSV